jgi:hypothetical protein
MRQKSPPLYDDSMRVSDARAKYFKLNGLPPDGGVTDKWARYKILGRELVAFPNFKARNEALLRHDLHHIVNNLDTSNLGEGLIAAWELGAGCGGYWVATVLNAQALWWGILLSPRNTFRHFLDGRNSRSLYHNPKLGRELEMTVGQLREELRPKRPELISGSMNDGISFLSYALLGLILFPIFFAIVFLFSPRTIFAEFLVCFLAFGFSQASYADSIDREVIFANENYAGGVLCNDVNAGTYCETPVPVSNSKGTPLDKKEKLQGACIKGGGDCTTAVFVSEIKAQGADSVLAKVSSANKKEVWLPIKRAKFSTLEKLNPSIGIGWNDLAFRPTLQFVFLDRELKTKLPVSEVAQLPKNRELIPEIEMLEYAELPSIVRDGQKIVGFRVSILKVDPEKMTIEPEVAKKEGQRTLIREIYFPAYDSQKRLNYWNMPDPGC